MVVPRLKVLALETLATGPADVFLTNHHEDGSVVLMVLTTSMARRATAVDASLILVLN